MCLRLRIKNDVDRTCAAELAIYKRVRLNNGNSFFSKLSRKLELIQTLLIPHRESTMNIVVSPSERTGRLSVPSEKETSQDIAGCRFLPLFLLSYWRNAEDHRKCRNQQK